MRIADGSAVAAPATRHDRVAIVDLGPGGGDVRRKLGAAVTAAGLELVTGDGIDDALGGDDRDADTNGASDALVETQRAFGALDCATATTAAMRAIHVGAARQAAGLPAPELPIAWAYMLLCADRSGEVDAAMHAVAEVRALGAGSAGALLPAATLARYPEIDATSNREVVDVEVRGDADGAAIWIDHHAVGVAPVHIQLDAGPHEIAAAAPNAGQRGAIEIVVDHKTAAAGPITVAMADQHGKFAFIAERIARWRKQAHTPVAGEIAALLVDVGATVAIVRRDDDAVVWTRFARSEPPHLASGDTTMMRASASDAIVALVRDRITKWNDHVPDPDQPLLVETADERAVSTGHGEQHTRWWVYATIAGALAVGAIVVYAHDSATDTQHVELHYP